MITRRNNTGEPNSNGSYALGLTPLLDHLQSVKRSVKHVAFADNLTGTGTLKEIKIWWDTLVTKVPNMVTTQSHQSHSIVK